MTLIKKSLLVILGSVVAACDMTETATRSAPLATAPLEIAETVETRSYDLRDFSFEAPEDIEVSEANTFYPNADVVWRGDPLGDRVEQVSAMFDTALSRNKAVLNGGTPVNVEIELVRFHGVTERTRFSVGGNYDMHFFMTVRDAVTGEVLEDRRFLQFDLAAPGGTSALMLDQQGQTEKVRVVDFLTHKLGESLTGPIAL